MLALTTIARLMRRLPERRRFSIRVRRFASVGRRESSLLVQRAVLFRLLHGYENGESAMVGSWRTCGYDHIFAFQALSAQSIVYLYTLKAHQLSDHMSIEAVFAPRTGSQKDEIVCQYVRESYTQSDKTRSAIQRGQQR